MEKKECIAMVFAGGRESKLGSLGDCFAKSAIFYGGNHRIIDFTLSNCRHSWIDTVGILTQHMRDSLHAYIDDGRAWKLSVTLLPPRSKEKDTDDYKGTGDAVYRNIDFIEQFAPKYVCVLRGEHVYKMNYRKMLDFHKRRNADVTIASTEVSSSESCGHWALDVDEGGEVGKYERKLSSSKGLTSMGVYIFNWDVLRKHLVMGSREISSHEYNFDADVIPAMISAGERVYAYRFGGYWRDITSVESLWASNMDLLGDPPEFVLQERGKEVLSPLLPSRLFGNSVMAGRNIFSGARAILGNVEQSVLADSVVVEEGAEVIESVLMPNVYVGKNAKVYKAIVGPGSRIMDNAEIGANDGIAAFVSGEYCTNDVSLIASWVYVDKNTKLKTNSHVTNGAYVNSFNHSNLPAVMASIRTSATSPLVMGRAG